MSAPLPQPSLDRIEQAPPAVDSAAAFDPAEAEQQILANRIAALLSRGKNGAHWFYWIAHCHW